MATPVSICSNALLMLGDKPIADFSEDTTRSRICANIYDYTRDSVLREHSWHCAIKRVALAPAAIAPVFGRYSNRFVLPQDWIKTIQVGDDGGELDYIMEDGAILARTSVLYLRYVYRNTNESTYDAMLIRVMTLAIKAAIAYTITSSVSMRDSAIQEYMQALRTAKSIDGQDDPAQTLGDFPLYSSRFGGGL